MKIDFLEFGKKGETIVFLHGWQQDKRSFSPLVSFLWKTHRLFLLDLPGFGQSDLPPDSFTSNNYAQVIVDWLREKKLKKVVLVGHSFGGKVACIIAADYPHIVSKLILIANSGIPHPKAWYPLVKLIPLSMRKTFKPLFSSRDYKEAGEMLEIFKTIVMEDIRSIFKKIKTPTLVIWGKEDHELPVSDGKEIGRLIEGSILEIIEGGHFPFIENPPKIAQTIDRFIKNEKI